jgi:hypothetical protein
MQDGTPPFIKNSSVCAVINLILVNTIAKWSYVLEQEETSHDHSDDPR